MLVFYTLIRYIIGRVNAREIDIFQTDLEDNEMDNYRKRISTLKMAFRG